MPLPLRDYVQQVLLENDRAGKIHHAVHRAWATTTEKYPERAGWIRKSTFRGIVWEEAVRELDALAADDPGITLALHRDTASFVVDDAVLFRFKHADVSLTTRNYPTSEAKAFDDHAVDLYGFTGLQRVELCYVLNEFETSIIWVGLSARTDGNYLWKIELSDTGIAAPTETIPMFEEEIVASALVRIKKDQPTQDDEKKKDNG